MGRFGTSPEECDASRWQMTCLGPVFGNDPRASLASSCSWCRQLVRGRSIDGAVPLAASRWTLGVRCIHGRGHGRTRRLVSANLEHDLATLPAACDSLE